MYETASEIRESRDRWRQGYEAKEAEIQRLKEQLDEAVRGLEFIAKTGRPMSSGAAKATLDRIKQMGRSRRG